MDIIYLYLYLYISLYISLSIYIYILHFYECTQRAACPCMRVCSHTYACPVVLLFLKTKSYLYLTHAAFCIWRMLLVAWLVILFFAPTHTAACCCTRDSSRTAIFVCSWCLRYVGSALFIFFAVCARMLLYAWLGVLLYLVELVSVYAVKALKERFMLVDVLLYVHCACVCVCARARPRAMLQMLAGCCSGLFS